MEWKEEKGEMDEEQEAEEEEGKKEWKYVIKGQKNENELVTRPEPRLMTIRLDDG